VNTQEKLDSYMTGKKMNNLKNNYLDSSQEVLSRLDPSKNSQSNLPARSNPSPLSNWYKLRRYNV
jgi:hypothetical protein